MKRDYEISLTKLLDGHKIEDIYGYVSDEFGDPYFKITRILLDTGRTMDVEGEHDMPYISDDKLILPDPEA